MELIRVNSCQRESGRMIGSPGFSIRDMIEMGL